MISREPLSRRFDYNRMMVSFRKLELMHQSAAIDTGAFHEGLERRLGLFDSTMIVAGSMIGSGIFIMISAFGCINGMLLAGARAYFSMARDGLFFSRAAALNHAHVPGPSLIMQGVWAA